MSDSKQKLYAHSLIFGSIILTMFYFGTVYFVNEEKILSSEIVVKAKKIEQLRSQSEQIEDIRESYDKWQTEINAVSDSIINYTELFNYIIEIEKLAKENSIQLKKDVSTKKKEQINDDFSYTYYKIKATGSFVDVMNFLTCFENMKYYSDMENILISVEDQPKNKYDNTSPEEVTLSADLKIYVYNSD